MLLRFLANVRDTAAVRENPDADKHFRVVYEVHEEDSHEEYPTRRDPDH
jgi:hypothetical protein